MLAILLLWANNAARTDTGHSSALKPLSSGAGAFQHHSTRWIWMWQDDSDQCFCQQLPTSRATGPWSLCSHFAPPCGLQAARKPRARSSITRPSTSRPKASQRVSLPSLGFLPRPRRRSRSTTPAGDGGVCWLTSECCLQILLSRFAGVETVSGFAARFWP